MVTRVKKSVENVLGQGTDGMTKPMDGKPMDGKPMDGKPMDGNVESQPRIVICYDNTATIGQPCAICSHLTAAEAGPKLALSESKALVCRSCGKKYAAEMVFMIDQFLVSCERDFGLIGIDDPDLGYNPLGVEE